MPPFAAFLRYMILLNLRRILRPILLLILIFTATTTVRAANSLDGHPSPYLALHAGDPVDWTLWQEEVFTRAQADQRLVFVSIGYFSCHWCHVMQQESYQDAEIARLLNKSYVAVKVDRELDPDLDQRLMSFVEKIRGSAGWPLNVFLTPDGYPLTGFTYLPPADFRSVLQKLDNEWRDRRQQISAAAKEFFLTQMQNLENQAFVAPDIPSQNLMDAFVSQSMLAADEMLGGFGNTSKFPNVPQLDTLLEIIGRYPDLDPDVADFVRLTLRMMAANNLHDHVNFGFFRYTTDPDWQTP
ncbi:MAG: thioredoxin domain-containing protein, partial [Gammaproteobacteria bacterium]